MQPLKQLLWRPQDRACYFGHGAAGQVGLGVVQVETWEMECMGNVGEGVFCCVVGREEEG